MDRIEAKRLVDLVSITPKSTDREGQLARLLGETIQLLDGLDDRERQLAKLLGETIQLLDGLPWHHQPPTWRSKPARPDNVGT